jgi:DNA (cytosine-5)-methyltransferase 1
LSSTESVNKAIYSEKARVLHDVFSLQTTNNKPQNEFSRLMLKVADLFCGGGGISQGLKQAGFSIVYGLDKDRAACETFQKNHPHAKVDHSDVVNLGPNSIPEFNILVGGPPCIEFSASKQGRGNILEGLRLVQEFLKVVYHTSPKYWIMENVPRIIMHLPEHIPLSWIGIKKKGHLEVPVRAEFNCANYGVPQSRHRFLMGNFPIPKETHFSPTTDALLGPAEGKLPWITLGEILSYFPNPIDVPTKGIRVRDPVYVFSLPVSKLSDHFFDTRLSSEEARRIRRVKEEHPFMGFMPFPDSTDVPARTVVATQLGRETLVIKTNGAFRRATVRECATLQSFPISYQFYGGSISARYRIVGDAVPPLLGFHIGRDILANEGLSVPDIPILNKIPVLLSPAPSTKSLSRKRHKFPEKRKFRELVPGKEVRGCRAQLDNLGEHPAPAQFRGASTLHTVEWVSRLHMGEGKKNMREKIFSVDDALQETIGYCASRDKYEQILGFISEIERMLPGNLPDATTLQARWNGVVSTGLSPEDVVDILSDCINQHFPKETYRDTFIPGNGRFPIIPRRGLRLRIALGLLVTAYACQIINSDTQWATKNKSKRFYHPSWDKTLTKIDHAKYALPSLTTLFLEYTQHLNFSGNIAKAKVG